MHIESSLYDTRFDTTRKIVSKNFSVRIVPRSRVNRDGTHNLRLDVTYDGERWRPDLGERIYKHEWNAAAEALKKGVPDYYVRQLIIDNIKSKCTEIKRRYKLMNRTLTVEQFKDEYLYGIPRVNFVAYMTYKLPKLPGLADGTSRRYQSVINKIKKWNHELTFFKIDNNFPARFKKYCEGKGNKQSTIQSQCAALRTFLSHAQDDNIFFPLDLDKWQVNKYDSSREYLLRHEAKRLFSYYESEFILPSHKLALGYFLISCVTGLRISEIKELQRFGDNDDALQIVAPKTGKKTTVYKTEQVKTILKECPDLFVIWLHDNTINKYLKIIAKTCKVNKTISMHVGRHSFAMEYLRAGGDILKLKVILKHSKIETTMKYLHQLDEEQSANIELVGQLFA